MGSDMSIMEYDRIISNLGDSVVSGVKLCVEDDDVYLRVDLNNDTITRLLDVHTYRKARKSQRLASRKLPDNTRHTPYSRPLSKPMKKRFPKKVPVKPTLPKKVFK